MLKAKFLTAMVAIAVGVTVVTGCTASEPDSCGELSRALQDASGGIVNAFSSVDVTPEEVVPQLREVQNEFDRKRINWAPKAATAGSQFSDALAKLIRGTEAATSALPMDAAGLQAATAEFQSDAMQISEACTPPSPISTP